MSKTIKVDPIAKNMWKFNRDEFHRDPKQYDRSSTEEAIEEGLDDWTELLEEDEYHAGDM